MIDPSFQIFLLIGQSNMAGRGALDEVDVIDDSRILMYRSGEWIKATEPLHQDNPEIAGIGPGMSFALELLKNEQDIKIGFIPCAVGWTSLTEWMPGSKLYHEAVSTTSVAMKSGTLKGILWHQGENDALNNDDAEKYGPRLMRLVSSLRKELNSENVPFISGRLANFLSTHEEFKYINEVNEHLQKLHYSVSDYGCVEVDGLKSKSDKLHFDSASQRELGKRYAQEYLHIKNTRIPDGNREGHNPDI